MTETEQIDKYISDRVDVKIVHTKETGEWLYAVIVDDGCVDDDDFWLYGFKKKKEAIAFCKHNKLKYTL